MQMHEYAGAYFMGPDDLADGPIIATITEVTVGRWNKPVLVFEDGAQVSVNNTNVRALIRRFGDDSANWIGCRVELSGGETVFEGGPAAPASKSATSTSAGHPKKPGAAAGTFNDDIPF